MPRQWCANNCGKLAFYRRRSMGGKISTTDKAHDLCERCYRDQRNALIAADRAAQQLAGDSPITDKETK